MSVMLCVNLRVRRHTKKQARHGGLGKSRGERCEAVIADVVRVQQNNFSLRQRPLNAEECGQDQARLQQDR